MVDVQDESGVKNGLSQIVKYLQGKIVIQQQMVLQRLLTKHIHTSNSRCRKEI